jgi:hypothetical protein
MKISKLPAPVIDRLVALDQHAAACGQAATAADARLAACRAAVNDYDFPKTGNRIKDEETHRRAKQELAGLNEGAQETRRRSDAARRVAASCRAFVDGLPDAAAIELAAVPQANGVDLSECRGRITGIRAKLAKLHSAPPPSDRGRIEGYIDELRKPAREHADRLVGNWPHFLNSPPAPGLLNDLLTAMASRDALVGWLCAKIDARAAELGPRPGELAALESELAGLQSLEAMFVNVKIESGDVGVVHSPETPAALVLGITVVERRAELAL